MADKNCFQESLKAIKTAKALKFLMKCYSSV